MPKPILHVFLAFTLCAVPSIAAPPEAPGVDFSNSPRVHDLIRAGNLYLSLSDALSLAIENNLDIQLQRFAFPVAAADLLRAQGGGTLRGVPFQVSEAPSGIAGPQSPVVTGAAAGTRLSGGTSVATNAGALASLGQPQTNLSVLGTIPQATGTTVPNFDPAVLGQLNWTHQTTPMSNFGTHNADALNANLTNANVGAQKAFSSGTLVNFTFTNNHQALNSLKNSYTPFTGSSLGFTVTQPLMRGFGANLNRRFIRIAGNNQKITSLLFQQQLIATAYGAIRLYTDFVALYEDQKVKQESLALAEKLFADTRAQVNEGTLAPVEMTRANAQVFSARQDLITSTGLLEEQEAILKNYLTRRGNEDPEVQSARLIPTDSLAIPDKEDVRPFQDLISEALANRPDLGQAQLQIENSRISLVGTRNATLPQVDLVGVMQNNGLGGVVNPYAPPPDTAFVSGYGGVLGQLLARNYPTYGVGLQVTLPLHNRIAEADLARDQWQLRQSEVRLRQLQNQARLEVEDATIAMRRARASYEAAGQARILQQQSLEVEQAKFEVGASTSFFVIQYESLLAQAKSTEVAAKSAYMKARVALQRATGTILSANQISVEAARGARP